MDSFMTSTPATGLPSYVMRERLCVAPTWTKQGTSVPFAGSSAGIGAVVPAAHAAQAAVAGVRVTDLPGSPPRGAPV